jgi:hypothetical protein
MGASPRYDREPSAHFEGDSDWNEPVENPDVDGCPGSYVYSPFVSSVLKYRRRPTGEGTRTPNRLLDLCDDELVLEAVEMLETCEDAWQSEHERWRFAQMRPERD